MTPLPGSPGQPGRRRGNPTGTIRRRKIGGNGDGKGRRHILGEAALIRAGKDEPRSEETETVAQTGGPGQRPPLAAAPAMLIGLAGGRHPAHAAARDAATRAHVLRQGTGARSRAGKKAAGHAARPLSASLGVARVVRAANTTRTVAIIALGGTWRALAGTGHCTGGGIPPPSWIVPPPTLPHPTRKRKREVVIMGQGAKVTGNQGRVNMKVRPRHRTKKVP